MLGVGTVRQESTGFAAECDVSVQSCHAFVTRRRFLFPRLVVVGLV